MLLMRACSQSSFAVDVWSRYATGGENALRDETKQSETSIAKEYVIPVTEMQFIFANNYPNTNNNRPRIIPLTLFQRRVFFLSIECYFF